MLAGCDGLVVTKHGNRSSSGSVGSADLLEAVGATLHVDGAGVVSCARECGFGFLFAPQFHPAMRFVGPARKAIGVPTVFNLLGPLTNPALPQYGVIGVGKVKDISFCSLDTSYTQCCKDIKDTTTLCTLVCVTTEWASLLPVWRTPHFSCA